MDNWANSQDYQEVKRGATRNRFIRGWVDLAPKHLVGFIQPSISNRLHVESNPVDADTILKDFFSAWLATFKLIRCDSIIVNYQMPLGLICLWSLPFFIIELHLLNWWGRGKTQDPTREGREKKRGKERETNLSSHAEAWVIGQTHTGLPGGLKGGATRNWFHYIDCYTEKVLNSREKGDGIMSALWTGRLG